MALLGWVMLGIALWHFAVFVPDRFWAGIVGAFLGAVVGAVLTGWALSGFSLPSQDDTNVVTILYALPGTLLGLAAVYWIGARAEGDQDQHAGTGPAAARTPLR